jgi:two-component system chemotaxis response regulator CheB
MVEKSNGSSQVSGTADAPIEVLVVDDSAVVREAFKMILDADQGFSVQVAADPILAMNRIDRRRPDVIVLDLQMPRMDGWTFLEKLMIEDPLPVVVCSSHSGPGTEGAIRALQAGAVALIHKPHLGAGDFLQDASVRLIDTIRAAAHARVQRRRRANSARAAQVEKPGQVRRERPRSARTRPVRSDRALIAIGASTGGTEALRVILAEMPVDAPPIVVVQHMLEGFTATFASHLDRVCQIQVKEAQVGDSVASGQAVIASGNMHMQVRLGMTGYAIDLLSGPLVARHRPSIDMLFHSVAQHVGASATGVLLTGMGDDGVDGLLAMRRGGACTLAQDEASCAVFGMPRAAVERGAVDRSTQLTHIASTILRHYGYS